MVKKIDPASLLKEHNADYLLLDDPTNIYYLTQLTLSAGRLLVSKKKMILFVDDRYAEKAKKSLKSQVVSSNNFEESLKKHIKEGSKVLFSSKEVSAERYLSWKKIKGITWTPVASLLAPLRMIKTKEEIAKIQAACDITVAGYQALLKQIKPGVTEQELSQKLKIFFLENGADIAFEPIIAFGDNAAVPHHSPTARPYKKGEIVQFDIGSKKEGYCSDFSRVAMVPKELEIIHEIVREAKEAAEELAVPGSTMQTLDKAARSVIQASGYGDRFLHTVGHGVGLQIHETPFVKQDPKLPLQEGMIITIEPGIYIEGVGGIRVEDTYLITKKGPRILTDGARC